MKDHIECICGSKVFRERCQCGSFSKDEIIAENSGIAAWGHYAADKRTLLNVFYAEPEGYTVFPGESVVPLVPDFGFTDRSARREGAVIAVNHLAQLVSAAESELDPEKCFLDAKTDKLIVPSSIEVPLRLDHAMTILLVLSAEGR